MGAAPVTTETTLREFAGSPWIDDGYEFMAAGAAEGWRAVASWGEDGWDLGSWPYVVVLFRERTGDGACLTCGAAKSEHVPRTVVLTPGGSGEARLLCSAVPSLYKPPIIHERAVYIEGDITIETWHTEGDRNASTDELAAFHWRHSSDPALVALVADVPEGEPLPERLRGPYRPARAPKGDA